MRKSCKIDECAYKWGALYGADTLIKKKLRPFVSNAEVYKIDADYWLTYDFDNEGYVQSVNDTYYIDMFMNDRQALFEAIQQYALAVFNKSDD